MLFERHRATLEAAVAAISSREFWTPYPESPSRSVYGETALDDGEVAFAKLLGCDFALPGLDNHGWIEGEESPYGLPLGVRYPQVAPEAAAKAATEALPAWRDAGPDVRTGVCLEILHRLNADSFTLAHAGMHTTGQPFVMAFQATGPHAQDRGLEAVAQAYVATTSFASGSVWDKPRRESPVDKEFHVVPRGVAVVIACRTFPTWNGYPGLFASLVTGNPVVVKPHPAAILPLALTVRVAREVLIEEGFSPDLISLVVDEPDERHGQTLALHPAVRIIDFTGSPKFGEWLEQHARQARVYTEKAGVNCIVLDSADDLDGMYANLANSLSLFSGQMCTAPQVVLVPRTGVATNRGRLSPADVGDALVSAIDDLLGDQRRAVNVLGAVTAPDVLQRLERLGQATSVLRPSAEITHPDYPDARLRSPLVLTAVAEDPDLYGAEQFGPISFVVTTDDTAHSLRVVEQLALSQGALTTSLYTTSDEVADQARDVALTAGTTLSVNLTTDLLMNQSAAFSDFHGSGNNPAANTTLVDADFVAGRFAIVEVRTQRSRSGENGPDSSRRT